MTMSNDKRPRDIAALSNIELLVTIAECQDELRSRGVIRTSNVTGDFAEMLVCKALGLKQIATAAKNVDAVGPDGKRYQIKARRITPWNTSRQLGGLRDLNNGDFDYLAGVLFNENYGVVRAAQMMISRGVHASLAFHENASYRVTLIPNLAAKVDKVSD